MADDVAGVDPDAPAPNSEVEFRADSASRPAGRGEESARALKCTHSQCEFRRRARPRARPRVGVVVRFSFVFSPSPKFAKFPQVTSLQHLRVWANSQSGPEERISGPARSGGEVLGIKSSSLHSARSRVKPKVQLLLHSSPLY